jgi:hypothetical protein
MPAESTPTAKVLKAQKVAVINEGGYVMRFSVLYNKANTKDVSETGATDRYPVGKTMVIDLQTAAPGITTGCKIWPKIDVRWGDDKEGPAVEYAPNGHTVTYTAGGVCRGVEVALLK